MTPRDREEMERLLTGEARQAPHLDKACRKDGETVHEWIAQARIHSLLVNYPEIVRAAARPAQAAAANSSRRFLPLALAAGLALLLAGLGWASTKFFVSKPAQPPVMAAAPEPAPAAVQPEAPATSISTVSTANLSAATANLSAADTAVVTAAVVTAAAPVTEVLTNAAAPIRAAALPTGGKGMNATTRTTAALLVAATTVNLSVSRTLADGSAEATLASVCVNKPRYWQTAFTNEIPIRWSWCPSAGAASLVVKGMNNAYPEAMFTTNATAAAFSWFLPASADEDLYTLTLTFLDQEGGDTLGVLTGTVARVNGTSAGATATGVTLDATSASASERFPVAAWPRVKRPGSTTDNVLIGYKASWAVTGTVAAATLSIQRQGNSDFTSYQLDPSEGWFAWEVKGSSWGYGWFDLLLDFNGEGSLSGKAYRPAAGTIFKFMGIQ